MQNVQRKGLGWEKRSKGMVKLTLTEFGFLVETMPKSPQISETDLCKWDDIIYVPTAGKECP